MMTVTPQTVKDIIQRPGLAIIDCWAEWCGPCKMFAPIFEQVAEGFKNVQFAKCDVDANPELAAQWTVRSIPTVIFFLDGTEIDRITGALSKEEFISKVQEHVK